MLGRQAWKKKYKKILGKIRGGYGGLRNLNFPAYPLKVI